MKLLYHDEERLFLFRYEGSPVYISSFGVEGHRKGPCVYRFGKLYSKGFVASDGEKSKDIGCEEMGLKTIREQSFILLDDVFNIKFLFGKPAAVMSHIVLLG